MPGHVLHSHYATVDVPLAFWGALAVYLAVCIVQGGGPRVWAWAGVAVGLAASTKYNGALWALAPLTAAVLVWRRQDLPARDVGRRTLVAVGLAVVAFALTSPYVLLDCRSAWDRSSLVSIPYEVRHMRQGEYPAKAADPNGWVFHLKCLEYDCGPAAGFVLLGLLLAVARYRREDAPLWVAGLLWFAAIGATGVRYGRYGVPLLPLLALLAAVAVCRPASRGARWRGWAVAGGLAMAGGSLLGGALLSAHMVGADWHDEGLRYLRRLAPAGQTVGTVDVPWFKVPPLDFYNGGAALGAMLGSQAYRSDYRLVTTGLDAARLAGPAAPQWFVESDFDLADGFRARDTTTEVFQAALQSRYALRVTVSGGGWTERGALLGPAPHDWLYPFATVRLWERREGTGIADPSPERKPQWLMAGRCAAAQPTP